MGQNIPELPGQPIFGNLSAFRNDRVGLLTSLPERYGDVARIRLGLLGRPLVLSAPQLMRETLVEKEDAFVKSVGLTVFARPMLGDGLLTAERSAHRRQRRLVAPAFAHQRIASYATAMGVAAERAVARLSQLHQVDLSDELMRLTFEIVGKTLFDADVSEDAETMRRALTITMEQINRQLSALVPLPPAVPSPGNLRALRCVREMEGIVYRLIRERRASGKDVGDLLSMLLAARDEAGDALTDQQVRDEAMTLMLAGHETISNALAWTFYLLARHPTVRAQLEEELDRVLAGRTPALADLAALPYTLQVFKEAMRLYPPVPMAGRIATRDVAIGGYEVPKNQFVILNFMGMHRRTTLFDAPLTFEPSRFAPERERARDKYAYLPFGAGPRVCIGNHFALMEGHILLAHLAQHLRFALAGDHVEPEPLITLRPKGGLRVRIERRKPSPLRAAS